MVKMWPFARARDEAALAASSAKAAEVAAYGAVQAQTKPDARTWEWENRGAASQLVVMTGIGVGNALFYLLLVSGSVLYSNDNLMQCLPDKVGLYNAMGCEWTKAHLRCFPCLGLAVAVVASSRTLLQQRIYYQLLKRNALLDFQNHSPLGDSMFKILVADFGMAMLHFVMLVFSGKGASLLSTDSLELIRSLDTKFLKESYQAAAFYVVPAVVFLSFLFNAYDTEQQLLPLSKFLDEDPNEAKERLRTMVVLPEEACAKVLASGFWEKLEERHPEATEGVDENIVFSELIWETTRMPEGENADEEVQESFLQWPLLSTLWPGKVLLTRRIAGEDSDRFKWAWTAFSVITSALMLLSILRLLSLMLDQVIHILDGQVYTDWAGFVVCVLHVGVWYYLARGFAGNMMTHSTMTWMRR